ncbi:MAG: hypothetical protein V1670_01775 [Candidatus Omnitrophota bacterium]
MKKIFVITAAVFFIMFAYFVARLSAQELPPPAATPVGISMDFKDADLKDILKVFSIQAQMNFIASEAVQDRKITLYLDKVPLVKAMDKIFSANNLSYELDSSANIFVVKEWGKMETETVTKVFFLKNATVSTSSLKSEMSKNINNSEKTEGGITSAVNKVLTKDVGSMIEDFRTNSIIVTDTPMKMKVISRIIASLDVSVLQVMLEVEMLDVSKNVIDKLGIDFGDTPFTAAITGATAAMGFPYGSWGKIITSAKGALSINSSPYEMQLDYIRTQTDTKYLARPKLLTLNNETAEIAITKDEVIGRNPIMGTSTTGAVTVTGYTYLRSTSLPLTSEGTGIFLRITPQINPMTNEITMVVNPKSSVTYESVFGEDSLGGKNFDAEIRNTKSIVKVKDGETVILGGLIHQDKSIAVKKLPILGDIPILGALFRHKEQAVGKERELIIFITPRIVRDKVKVKIAQVQNIPLPIIREQAVPVGSNRDYIINTNMNKFDKNFNGKR